MAKLDTYYSKRYIVNGESKSGYEILKAEGKLHRDASVQIQTIKNLIRNLKIVEQTKYNSLPKQKTQPTRRRTRKTLLDWIFDLVDKISPPEKIFNNSKDHQQSYVIPEKPVQKMQPKMEPPKQAINENQETNLQDVYNKSFVYEGKVVTGKQLLMLSDKLNNSESGQLAFVNALLKMKHLKAATAGMENSIRQTKAPINAPVSSTAQKHKNEITNKEIQVIYKRNYIYCGKPKTGYQVLNECDQLRFSTSAQLAFVNGLLKTTHLKNAIPGNKVENSTVPLLSSHLQEIYETYYMYLGFNQTGKRILEFEGKLHSSEQKQIEFIETRLKNRDIVVVMNRGNSSQNYSNHQSTRPLSSIDKLHKEVFNFKGRHQTGYEILRNANKLGSHASTQIAYLAALIRMGHLQANNQAFVQEILSREIPEQSQDAKTMGTSYKQLTSSVNKPSRSNSSYKTPSTVAKYTSNANSSKVKQQKPQQMPKDISGNNRPAIQNQAEKVQAEESIGKSFGHGAGLVTGLALGGPFAILGEITGWDMATNIGEKIIRSTTQAGEIIGEAASGGINATVGVFSEDTEAYEKGKKQLTSAGKTLGKGIVHSVENVVDNTGNIIDGIRYGDEELLKEGAKNLITTTAAGIIGFGVIDGVADIALDADALVTDASTDSNIAVNSGDMASQQNMASSNMEQHFVNPHEVSSYVRSDGTYVEGYIRDGDGDTSINRTVEQGGGYLQGNPKS